MLKFWMEKWFGKIDKNKALIIKRKLSLVYAFVGWNSFIVVFYQMVNMSREPGEKLWYSKLTGAPENMYKYQVKGFTLTDEGFDLAYKAKLTQERKEAEERQNKRQIEISS